MERVIERDNLRLAFWKAACGKRTKRDAALFAARLDGNLEDLRGSLTKRYTSPERIINSPSTIPSSD